MYENYKIYGPYTAKDGRQRIIAIDENNIKHTISYPKYILECHLGRYLTKEEQIDHIDGNPLNNDISNLQIILFKEHQKLDAICNKDIVVKCAYCGKEFIIKGSKLSQRNRIDRGQSGYFCSKTCSGKYGSEIQKGNINPNFVEKVIPIKFKVKSAIDENQ